MIGNKEIRKEARKKLTHPYWRGVFMSIVIILTTTGVLNSMLMNLSGTSQADQSGGYTWLFIKYIVRFYHPDFLIADPSDLLQVEKFTFFDYLGNSLSTALTSETSFPFYIGYSILSAHATNTVNAIWTAIFGCILYFLLIAFFLHPTNIGARYYFLKRMQQNGKERVDEKEKNAIIQGGFNRFYLNIVFTRILKSVFFFLASLTIVGGFILYYAYYAVDYIIMENPSLDPIQTLRLSRQMMKGNKWKLFRLHLSFIGWEILSYLTFNLLNIFYLKPYRELADSKAYLEIKESFIKKNPTIYRRDYLETYELNSKGLILRQNINYDVPYELVDYALIFFIISFGGWCWEVFYNFIRTYEFANRGTLWGPVLPIYGTGAVLALFLLKKTRKAPWLSFLLSIAVCLTIEYFTGYYLEKTKGVRYWSYDSMPFNLNGRICLFGGLLFGVGCLFAIYFVGPLLYPLLHRFGKKTRWTLVVIFAALILVDTIVSQFYPNPDGMQPIASIFLSKPVQASHFIPTL